MGNRTLSRSAFALFLVIGLAIGGPAVAQQVPPTLQVQVPQLEFGPGSLEASDLDPSQCDPMLLGPAPSATQTFTGPTPVNSSYHAAGPVIISLEYTSGAQDGAGEPASTGIDVTVVLKFGSAEVGSSTATIPPGQVQQGTTHEIAPGENLTVAPAGSAITVEVTLTSNAADGTGLVNNIALECGTSNVAAFQINAGAPGDGDLDGDGVPDAEDSDMDGDNVPNASEAAVQCDVGDTSYDFARESRLQPGDNDADNDGYTDEEECAAGSDPLSALSQPPQPAGFPWGLLILLLVLVALIAFLVFFFLTFGKAVSVEVVSQSEIIVPKGEQGKFQLLVSNLRKKGEPINFQLSASGQPEGWDATLDQDHVVLEPQGGAKSSETVWLTVESPEHDDAESAVVAVRAVALNTKGKKDTLKLPAKAQTITSINVPPDAKVPVKRGADVKTKTETDKAKGSGKGDVEKVIDVEGIGPEYAKKLEEAGVVDTKQLLDADAKKLAKSTGISENLIVTWQQMADLIRVNGIAGQIAEILVRSGITSVEQLAGMEPKEVVSKCEEYLATLEKAPTKQKITEKFAKRWVEGAQALTGAAPAAAAAAGEEKPAKGKKAKAKEEGAAGAPAAEKPQLQVGNLQHSPATFRQGQDVKSTVTVTNNGQGAHTLKLSLYVNDQLADAQTVNVKPGKTKDVKFKWAAQEQNKLNIRGEIVPS